MFGSLFTFFGQFQDLEGLFELLFEIRDGLGILLGEFEGKSEFCGLVGHVSGEFGDFIVEDFLVVMGSFECSVEFIILVFESN